MANNSVHCIVGPQGPTGAMGPPGPQGPPGIGPLTAAVGGFSGQIHTVLNGIPQATIGGGSYAFTSRSNSLLVNSGADLVINLNGSSIPQGNNFSGCRELYCSDLKLDDDERKNNFHYNIWIALHSETCPDYGVVIRSGEGCFPAFGSESSRKHFEEWFEMYKNRFYGQRDMSETTLPELCQGEVRGFFVEDDEQKFGGYDIPSDPCGVGSARCQEWAYIVSHCRDAAVRLKNGWLFSNDADAVMFKMR